MIGLRIVAAVGSGIVTVVSLYWYTKSKNPGHLFFAVAFGAVAGIFGYLLAIDYSGLRSE